MPTMPFGRHKGRALDEIPLDYLRWLTGIELRPFLRTAVEDELERRRNGDAHRNRYTGGQSSNGAEPVIRVDSTEAPLLAEVVERGIKAAARVHHPDLGGSAQLMTRLNLLAERLRKQLSAWERQ